jgi:hypothetical protein
MSIAGSLRPSRVIPFAEKFVKSKRAYKGHVLDNGSHFLNRTMLSLVVTPNLVGPGFLLTALAIYTWHDCIKVFNLQFFS